MINTIQIEDNKFNYLFQEFERAMIYVQKLENPIKLSSYSYFLRLALNGIKDQDFNYLILRLIKNKDLENNEGGYSIDYLGENNPKSKLEEIIKYLKQSLPKTNKIKSLLFDHYSYLVADQNDSFYLEQHSNCPIYSSSKLKINLKKGLLHNKAKLYFYTFNGQKDFDFLYNLPFDIHLILYPCEQLLYNKQLQNYKQELEQELMSNDRFELCGIKYKAIKEEPIRISPTLEEIVQRLDERSQIAYNGYINECDSLLDELDYKIQYQINFTNKKDVVLDSNEIVFDESGNLVRVRDLNPNDKIRIYPKELSDNLLQIAVNTEPEIYGKVLEYSELWIDILERLDKKFNNREKLYKKLKEAGLKVQSSTVDAYFKRNRKYPMFDSDLKAILLLGENDDLVKPIIKAKRLYNSTSIALGRGLKQELKQFLQERTLGDILTKRNFSSETLSRFIIEKMPLLTISNIKEKEEEDEYL